MKVGDLLEWLAAAGLSYGGYQVAGRAGAAYSGAVCLAYLAQCYSTKPLTFGRVGRLARVAGALVRVKRKKPSP